jgi:hypothetical protein
MDKQQAIKLLGGSIRSASEAIGVTYKAVHKWPDPLTPRIADRVAAAIVRMNAQKPKYRRDSGINKVVL